MGKGQTQLPQWVFGKDTVPYTLAEISTDYRMNVIASAKFFHKNNQGLVTIYKNDLKPYFKCTDTHYSRLWKTVNQKKLTNKLDGRHYHLDLRKAKGLSPNQFKLLDFLCRQCNIGLKGRMDTTFSDLATSLNLSWQAIKDEMIILSQKGLITYQRDRRKGVKGLYNIVICPSTKAVTPEVLAKTTTKTFNKIPAKEPIQVEVKEKKDSEFNYEDEEERAKCMKIFDDFFANFGK